MEKTNKDLETKEVKKTCKRKTVVKETEKPKAETKTAKTSQSKVVKKVASPKKDVEKKVVELAEKPKVIKAVEKPKEEVSTKKDVKGKTISKAKTKVEKEEKAKVEKEATNKSTTKKATVKKTSLAKAPKKEDVKKGESKKEEKKEPVKTTVKKEEPKTIAKKVTASKKSVKKPVEKVVEKIESKQVEKVEVKENNKIKVLYVVSECQPFIATGGLGEVAGSLPKAITAMSKDVDIRVVLPLYAKIKKEYAGKLEFVSSFTTHLAWRQEYCGIFKLVKDNVVYYFIDNERYFNRENVYGYYDDGERFAYFCKAIVEGLAVINFFPDIIHCNDWQSALVSAYIKTGDWADPRYYNIKNIYTIHNVEYQGIYGMECLEDLFGVNYRFKNSVEYNGKINLTKAAIQYCDKISTVSNTYCDDLKQECCSGGLNHIIKRNEYKLCGIVNGIDYSVYNPINDKIIYKQYDVNSLENKVENKLVWQKELGLPVDKNIPMMSIVSRLASHKGLDLLMEILEDVLSREVQLVVVGTGDQKYVDYFKYLQSKYPTKVRAMVDKYSYELGRKAYAASDIFLMPSKSEPCGISQMIASRYGSVPIVRETGGLKDTIKDFGCKESGNGYTFASYNSNDLKNQINHAINDFADKENWKKKMQIVMNVDFSWEKSALKYIDLYKSFVR